MAQGALSSRTTRISFEAIGDALASLKRGEIVGRLVVAYD
jgi:hypothetical protein